MYRGTTPILTFTLPFSTNLISKMYITFSQDDSVVLEKKESDCTMQNYTVTLNLSQADTLSIAAKRCKMQVRILDSSSQAWASNEYTIEVHDVLKSGSI